MKRFFLPLCRGLFWLAAALFLGGLVLHFAGYNLASALPYVRWYALADLVLGTAALFAAGALTPPDQPSKVFGLYLLAPAVLCVGAAGSDPHLIYIMWMFVALFGGMGLGLLIDRFYRPGWEVAHVAYQTARLEKLIPTLAVSDSHKARYHTLMAGLDGDGLARLYTRLSDPETIMLV